jgi:hypothetical protein
MAYNLGMPVLPLAAPFLLKAISWQSTPVDLTTLERHHTHHAQTFGQAVPRLNRMVLEAVDRVQATQPDGGGYFTGVTAAPAESPIGYPVSLFGAKLLDPPRTTSYCSGSSYAAFIEALNLAFEWNPLPLSDQQTEALRMQEPDGGRREDHVKFWGWWNADGPGSEYALVQYGGGLGERIPPQFARPGDFININWKTGVGHSVVFLGWAVNQLGQKGVLYWSSQKGTNGLGDDFAAIDKIKDVVVVRLTHPEKLRELDPAKVVDPVVVYDALDWR